MDPKSAIYQLKVTLEEVRPPIWRRFQVPADLSFAELHMVLQIIMGWDSAHLYQFEAGGKTVAAAMILEEWGERGLPADTTLLNTVIGRVGASFIYEYDFGDGWRHKVELEKMLKAEAEVTYPRCLAGERACPPEDCGGPWGYAELLEAWKQPEEADQDLYGDWLHPAFDPEAFDPEDANKTFAASKAAYQALIDVDIITNGHMTRPAQELWDDFPEGHKKLMLIDRWCPACRESTLMVDFRGRMVRGNLLLEGACDRCGEEIKFLVESE